MHISEDNAFQVTILLANEFVLVKNVDMAVLPLPIGLGIPQLCGIHRDSRLHL